MNSGTERVKTVYAKWVAEDGRFAFSSADNGGVEITDSHRQDLLDGETNGWRIAPDKTGKPVLVEPPPPSPEVLAAQARQWRDAEIESVKWLRERHRDEIDSQRPTTLTVKQSGELLDYVQALRDWPKDTGFPAVSSRPVPPAWIADQVQ
ncbi:phage tail assembly chaperone [Pseudomonas haemolytica]|uniref:Phage tail protein n=1 Tax=Pseudomonas haemolytica TaxID=2600065 RepID=A0ABS1GXE3_9PSED|nr:phage tail assembly chaperone [Pseudomonas haemolytica]MBK3461643.1 phage tail protein [Pseudomonas haemolytica]